MSNVANFRKVPVKIPYKSGFDKSFRNTMTGTTGTLIPVFVDELVANSDVYLRMPFVLGMPPLATDTFMNVNYKLEAFWVPTRLLMKGYEKWINGDTEIKYTVDSSNKIRTPVISFDTNYASDFGAGTLSDYLGFKSNFEEGYTDSVTLCAFPWLAYHLIYEEWYRNSLIQSSIFSNLVSSSYDISNFNSVIPSDNASVGFSLFLDDVFNDGVELGELRQRNFGADYFTVATPSPQNGPAIGVNLSLNTSYFEGAMTNGFNNDFLADEWVDDIVANQLNNSVGDGGTTRWSSGNGASSKAAGFTTYSGITSNQSPNAKSGGFTIASLRAANSLQQFLERNNIAGNRFVDFLRANYGANLSDGVAQRPVYLGSSSTPVYVSGVLQTANTADASSNNPFDTVGSNYGRAIAQDKDFVVKFHCEEPGYLMVIGSLVPEVTYASGIERYLMRYTRADSRTDMANHLLQNVGPQPVFKSELNSLLASTDMAGVFGYVDRYADWMTRNSSIHGLIRDGENLESFALQRTVDTQDGLSSSFLRIPTSYLDQVMAVTNAQSGFSYWIDFYCDYKVSMPLARYSIPTLQDPAYEHGDTIWLNRAGVRID